MLSQMAGFPSLLLLNNIPPCVCMYVYVYTHTHIHTAYQCQYSSDRWHLDCLEEDWSGKRYLEDEID